MNPITTVVAVVIAAWAVADLLLIPRGRALRVGDGGRRAPTLPLLPG